MSTARWLGANPAPIRNTEMAAWVERVREELGDSNVGDLVWLLEHGSLEHQYQAMAALRCLGIEVWAEGEDPNLTWVVTYEGSTRRFTPSRQLAG